MSESPKRYRRSCRTYLHQRDEELASRRSAGAIVTVNTVASETAQTRPSARWGWPGVVGWCHKTNCTISGLADDTWTDFALDDPSLLAPRPAQCVCVCACVAMRLRDSSETSPRCARIFGLWWQRAGRDEAFALVRSSQRCCMGRFERCGALPAIDQGCGRICRSVVADHCPVASPLWPGRGWQRAHQREGARLAHRPGGLGPLARQHGSGPGRGTASEAEKPVRPPRSFRMLVPTQDDAHRCELPARTDKVSELLLDHAC